MDTIDWSLLFDISEWVIAIVMTPVLMRRRPQIEGMAWIVVVFLVPWPGLIAYLLLGSNRLPRRRIAHHIKTTHAMEAAQQLLALRKPHVVHPELPPQSAGLVRLAESVGELPILGGNDVALLSDTSQYIDQLIADVEAATHHVHLLYYIYEADATGKRMTEALAAAAKRGVECRVLADAVGSWAFWKDMGPWLKERGVQVNDVLPVNPFRRRLARLDLRNHRKLAVIDGRIAYTGSQNITDPHYGPKRWPWRETSVRITGPVVPQLQAIYIEDWFSETDQTLSGEGYFPQPMVTGNVPVQPLPSGPTLPMGSYQRLVVAAVHSAQEQVTLTSPYIVPDEPFLQALETAVARGVEVTVIVPRCSDQPLTCAAGRAYYQNMLDAGIRIYDHLDGILHAKTMTVDDTLALVGSGNFDNRSFYLNFELNLLMYGEPVTKALLGLQRGLLDECVRLDPDTWRQRPFLRRTVDDMAKLLSPLL